MNMKWDKENDNKLKQLILLGKKHKEISEIFGVTTKSISNRCERLKLKTIYKVTIECLNCGKNMVVNKGKKRKFCDKSCSAKFSNKNRTLNETTKQKISNKLKGRKLSDEIKLKISGDKNGRYINGNTTKINIENEERKCKICENTIISKKYKRICDDCNINYYKHYRPQCEFRFNVYDYEDNFDLTLVNEFGWYSPTNKNNNLSGVSRDHIYSVRDGFLNKISPEIIRHPANCKLMLHTENSSKNNKSNITIVELLERIKNFK